MAWSSGRSNCLYLWAFPNFLSAKFACLSCRNLESLILKYFLRTVYLCRDTLFIMEAANEKTVSEAMAVEKVSSSEGDTSLEWVPEDEKRIRRRMDVRIVPTVFILYLLCFVDR